MEFEELLYITFTCESQVFSPPLPFIECAQNILKEEVGSKTYNDETLLQYFYNCVEFYRDAFSFKEGDHNKKDVEAVMSLIDVKGPEIKVYHKKVMQLLGKPRVSFVEPTPHTMVKKNISIEENKTAINKEHRRAKKLEKQQQSIKTQEEILKEEEEKFREVQLEDEKLKETLSKDGFHLVVKKVCNRAEF